MKNLFTHSIAIFSGIPFLFGGVIENPPATAQPLLVEAPTCICDPVGDSLALVAFYNSTNGTGWSNTWDLAQPVATWYGVTVDAEGCVTCLDLDGNPSCNPGSNFGNNLIGSIPPQLGVLSNLTKLYLSNNQLSGNIPLDIGSLGSLTWLDLSNNQLSGSIPPELEQLTNLTRLDLSYNQLSNDIPPELGNLDRLERLDLPYNQLSGSIPSGLGGLGNLTWLDLSFNQLSGSIPPELENLVNLEWLWLNSNQLSGNIPPELSNLANLERLWLSSNQLSGGIPSELGNLTNLEELSLYDNQLSDSIPPELGSLASLLGLYLHINQLSGGIPPELGNLSDLIRLILNNNQLDGNIPPELGNLTDLRRFYLHDNNLEGCFPEELLTHCDLDFSPTIFQDGYNLINNPLLPWQGDFTKFCDGETQIGAACDDGIPGTTDEEILPNCSCAEPVINASVEQFKFLYLNQPEISPNPFENKINIKSFSLGVIGEVRLFNTLGVSIYDFSNEGIKMGNEIHFNTPSHLPSGVYFLLLKIGDKWFSSKLIKS